MNITMKKILFGSIGAIIGGAIFAGIGIITGWLLGLFAIVAGFISGLAIKMGDDNKEGNGILGAIFGLISIIIGYYILNVYFIPFMSFGNFMSEMIKPIDILFILAGIYAGAKAAS
jgi:uncharacterized membrane protein